MKNWKTGYKILFWVVIAAIIIAIYMNWNKISSMWSTPKTKRVELMDSNGNATGKFVNVPSSSLSRMTSCCSVGSGYFVGKGCKFPVGKGDNIPGCNF